MTECDCVRFDGADIEFTVVRSRRRRKTLQITLDRTAGIVVAAPEKTTREWIRQTVLNRARWILLRASADVLAPRPREFVTGESLPYLGRQEPLIAAPAGVRRVTIDLDDCGFRILVPERLNALGPEARRAGVERALVAWYRARAALWLSERVAHWAGSLGKQPTSVLVRDQRRRWGSCAPDGVLRFNWRLVMAPPDLIDYVVVHELAHLKVPGHGADFWAEVGRAMPDFKLRRARLRKMGPELTI